MLSASWVRDEVALGALFGCSLGELIQSTPLYAEYMYR